MVIILHSRPIYYDDLVIKNYNDEESANLYDDSFRKKYQNIFRWIVTVTSSAMIGVTVSLWYFRDSMFSNNGHVVNSFVIVGVIGGMLRIYYAATMLIGRFIMILLRYLRKREQQRLRNVVEQRTLIELTSMGMRIGNDTDADSSSLLPRTASCHNFTTSPVVGFKPTIMVDIFND